MAACSPKYVASLARLIRYRCYFYSRSSLPFSSHPHTPDHLTNPLLYRKHMETPARKNRTLDIGVAAERNGIGHNSNNGIGHRILLRSNNSNNGIGNRRDDLVLRTESRAISTGIRQRSRRPDWAENPSFESSTVLITRGFLGSRS